VYAICDTQSHSVLLQPCLVAMIVRTGNHNLQPGDVFGGTLNRFQQYSQALYWMNPSHERQQWNLTIQV
jgi:hypothetical protein